MNKSLLDKIADRIAQAAAGATRSIEKITAAFGVPHDRGMKIARGVMTGAGLGIFVGGFAATAFLAVPAMAGLFGLGTTLSVIGAGAAVAGTISAVGGGALIAGVSTIAGAEDATPDVRLPAAPKKQKAATPAFKDAAQKDKKNGGAIPAHLWYPPAPYL